MADAMVTARMSQEKKEAGNRVLEQLGTNASQVVNRLYDYVLAVSYTHLIAKVSLVGTGMKSSPGVAARAFSTLGENQINILAISTSPIRLSVVVDGAQAAAAVRCLHKAFDLDSDSVFEETQLSAEEIAAKMNKGR